MVVVYGGEPYSYQIMGGGFLRLIEWYKEEADTEKGKSQSDWASLRDKGETRPLPLSPPPSRGHFVVIPSADCGPLSYCFLFLSPPFRKHWSSHPVDPSSQDGVVPLLPAALSGLTERLPQDCCHPLTPAQGWLALPASSRGLCSIIRLFLGGVHRWTSEIFRCLTPKFLSCPKKPMLAPLKHARVNHWKRELHTHGIHSQLTSTLGHFPRCLSNCKGQLCYGVPNAFFFHTCQVLYSSVEIRSKN